MSSKGGRAGNGNGKGSRVANKKQSTTRKGPAKEVPKTQEDKCNEYFGNDHGDLLNRLGWMEEMINKVATLAEADEKIEREVKKIVNEKLAERDETEGPGQAPAKPTRRSRTAQ